jgi:hypothetical protein
VKKTLIISEVFDPEDFLINDLVDSWIEEGRQLEVLTRNPSYPFDKIFDGYSNGLYNSSLYKNTVKVHRFLVIKGYQKSLTIKMLNYLNYMVFSFFILLFIGRRFDQVFVYQTGPLSNAFSAALLKPIFGYKLVIWSQDLWPETIYAF